MLESLKNCVVLDIETSGFSAKKNAICSISMKKFNEDIKLNIYIKPNNKYEYNPQAMEVNGLTLEFLEENGMEEERAIMEVISFIKNNFEGKPITLGHNSIGFDIPFLEEHFNTYNLSFKSIVSHHSSDSMIIARFLRDIGKLKTKSVSLVNCYKECFGKDFEGAHESMSDVFATEAIYNEFIKMK